MTTRADPLTDQILSGWDYELRLMDQDPELVRAQAARRIAAARVAHTPSRMADNRHIAKAVTVALTLTLAAGAGIVLVAFLLGPWW